MTESRSILERIVDRTVSVMRYPSVNCDSYHAYTSLRFAISRDDDDDINKLYKYRFSVCRRFSLESYCDCQQTDRDFFVNCLSLWVNGEIIFTISN